MRRPGVPRTVEAQAFAMTLRLYQQDLFTWPEWAETLTAEIRRAQEEGDPDRGDTYYHHWLAALERIVEKKGLPTPPRSAARRPPGAMPPTAPSWRTD